MFTHTLSPRFNDLDIYNHVNNAVYLTYFEEARIGYMTATGLRSLYTRERSTIVAHAEIDCKAPAKLGDVLDIHVSLNEIRNSSYTLIYRVVRRGDDALIATGKTVQVCFNFVLNTPTRIPEDWRAVLQNGLAADALR